MGNSKWNPTFGQVPLLALVSVPLAFLSVWLGGGGHGPIGALLPFVLVYGPLAFLWQAINFTSTDNLSQSFFAYGSPYLLYLLYGLLFVFFNARSTTQGRAFVVTVLVLHGISGLLFLILNVF